MNRSELERMLAWQIKAAKLPLPKEQFRAVPGRRWAWDLAWPECHILLEINGGTWGKGGHSTGTGIERDYEKANAATLLGWHCFSVTTNMVRDGRALNLVREALDAFPPF